MRAARRGAPSSRRPSAAEGHSRVARPRSYASPLPAHPAQQIKNPRIRSQTGEDTGILKLLSKPLASGLSAAATELTAYVLVVLQSGAQFLRQGRRGCLPSRSRPLRWCCSRTRPAVPALPEPEPRARTRRRSGPRLPHPRTRTRPPGVRSPRARHASRRIRGQLPFRRTEFEEFAEPTTITRSARGAIS